ncbi:hypothetical protein [Azoarcus olearius]|uniref:hypothetical protein n=1 Tax=Azoarcus sp. (strain BH72) TaxID=418699 RepID=UPI0012ED0006|nr:hypothetical protein [Azoarcus olearius]
MIDELAEFAAAVAIDVEAERAAKKHRSVRIFRAFSGALFLAVIASAVCLTFIY